jgi:precorrin-4/cobalt-precorrin-4 C11-methyltransferase
VSTGCVRFVGCGPGAADLMTVRAVRALNDADIVIWNASMLTRETLAEHMRADAELVQWPPAGKREILEAYNRARDEGLLVVRLTGGDPTLFGVLEPELSAARERGLACEIVPGVSAFTATAAALVGEAGTRDEPLLLVDAVALYDDGPAEVAAFAVWGANRDPRALQRALADRGLAASTPCVVAIEVSRPDQTLVPCALEDLAETLEDHALGVLTLAFINVPDRSEPGPDSALSAPGHRRKTLGSPG